MKRWWILLVLLAYHASATVEDMSSSNPSAVTGGSSIVTGSYWQGSIGPSLQSVPSTQCQIITGCLTVKITQTGSTSETKDGNSYTTAGKTTDYVVSVKNEGPTDVEAELSVDPENCNPNWFSWSTKTLQIPAGVSRSESLQVKPDTSALAGTYKFDVEASAKCRQAGISNTITFNVQDFDYASETMVTGNGQFQINKDVRSMNSGIKSDKNIFVSGSVDALVKNEYLVDSAKGKVANFEEQDAVDSYTALKPGDALSGTEAFKSSIAFGGIGAKLQKSFNVQQMEFQNQDFNIHQTGSLPKSAELHTADNFTGYMLIDAKQIQPGQKSIKERDEYLGSFEINRRIEFKELPSFNSPCFGDACDFMNKINALSKQS